MDSPLVCCGRFAGHLCRFAIALAALSCLAGCATRSVVVAPITITTLDINNTVVTTSTLVTRVDENGVCEYKLEFSDPNDSARSIAEVGGNRGPAQRIQSCLALPPGFTATSATNAAWFEEQTLYFWTKKARDYAKASLWITPPNWEGAAPKFANAELGPNVLVKNIDATGFATACFPRDPPACMRFWPGTNPKVFVQAGRVSVDTVVHEYGHYAAGFVFGHMDTASVGGFDIASCVHRSFQEGIAEAFNQLLRHQELSAAGITAPVVGYNSQWRNECTVDEYPMARPLWEAFTQAVWGTGTDENGNPVSVPWTTAAEANIGMANALTAGLATVTDFEMHLLAQAAVEHVEKNQPAAIAAAVRAIFASHGLTAAPNGRYCAENHECASKYCDRGDSTSKTSLCMPAASTGVSKDMCTHDNQCASTHCVGLTMNRAGQWIPGRCEAVGGLGEQCLNNTQCASGYCDRGNNTSHTSLCLPARNTGATSNPCSHDSQCASQHCVGLATDVAGNWVPGVCSDKADLGQLCQSNADCDSNDCDVGAGAAGSNTCTPSPSRGQLNDLCTQHAQCATGLCAQLGTAANGVLNPGRCSSVGGAIGQVCSSNSECTSQYCDAGSGTSRTNLCLPRGGTGTPGTLCSHDNQCVTGFCGGLSATSSGTWIPGQCALPGPLGQACGNNGQCASGYCDAGLGTSRTAKCMPRGATGQVGDICSHDNQCASSNCNGLAANSAGEWIPGQCAAKLGLGKSCSANYLCASGYCDAGNGTSHTSQCMPGPGAGANGQTCSHDNQCATGNCAGLRSDSYNNWIPGTCAAKSSLGASCTANAQCASSYCDAGNGTSHTSQCMPRGGTGLSSQPCSHPNQCASGTCNGLTPNANGSWNPGTCL
jgi:hypothetical protein